MNSLEAAVQRLVDIEDIRRLKAAYCAACDDDHNGDAVAALFVPDGTWQQSASEPQVGRDAIARYMYRIRDAGFMRRSAHMVTNPVIDVAGDSAEGRWRFVMMYSHTDGGFVRIIGQYEETYERVDARWYFRSLMANVEERGRYAVAD